MLLMHENIPVADVDIYLGNISNVKKIITPEHLPIGTNHPGPLLGKYLNSWLKDRAIPFNRQSLDLYTEYFGCNTLEVAQAFGSFSLTDHYWFTEEGSGEKWEDLCFQQNGFSSNFTDFFLDIVSGEIPCEDKILKIPDVNTDGVLPKVWIQTAQKGFHLFKLGEYTSAYENANNNYHLLSANEVACSRIAKKMNINAVEYKGVWLPGIENPICECPNFVPNDCEFVTLAQIAKDGAGEKLDLYGKICSMGYKKEIEDMIRFFFLIHNKDGHTKNCGFLRNAKTLEIESFAPLFDHGCSLNYDRLGKTDQSVKPFRATRLEQISLVETIGDVPDFNEVSEIIKETYDHFGVSDIQTDFALEDLIQTYNEWEKIIEKERDKIDEM